MAQRAHYLIVRVTFDEPCTAREAALLFKNHIWGYYYPHLARVLSCGSADRNDGPREMKVCSGKPAPRSARSNG